MLLLTYKETVNCNLPPKPVSIIFRKVEIRTSFQQQFTETLTHSPLFVTFETSPIIAFLPQISVTFLNTYL